MPFPADDPFADLAGFAERQAHAHFEDHHQRYGLPVETRVAAGAAIRDLYFQSRRSRPELGDVFTFVASHNESRLRAGSRLRLSRGDPRVPVAKVEMIHDDFDGEQFIFSLAIVSRETQEPLESPGPWVLDEELFDLLDVELLMLREAQKAGLSSWLAGEDPSRRSEADAGRSSPMAEGLEGSLRQAFCSAVAARNWFAVQGPPGSGKTHLLARLALDAALSRGQRVLITAVSHQAIHKALAECYWTAAHLKTENPVRRPLASEKAALLAGAASPLGAGGDPGLLDRRFRGPDVRKLLSSGFFKLGTSKANNAGLPAGVRTARQVHDLRGPLVAGATMYAVFNSLDKTEFPLYDLVLFDEAGQAPLSLALAGRLAGAKAVFIGDDRQLPPVVQSVPETESERLASRSALHMIRDRYEAPFLVLETRRLNAQICRAVSECFYEGKLTPLPEAAEKLLPIRRTPQEPFREILSPDHSLIFLDVPHKDARAFSEREARWTAAIAQEAVRCGLPPESIGAMSPYRAQCNQIRFLLRNPEILVATAERFQGQEREMIILSLASSNAAYLGQLRRFLFSSNRLNVAVSRARTKAILIGSKAALERFAAGADPDLEEAQGCRDFLKLLKHCRVVASETLTLPEATAHGDLRG